jgi:hypothetical protein
MPHRSARAISVDESPMTQDRLRSILKAPTASLTNRRRLATFTTDLELLHLADKAAIWMVQAEIDGINESSASAKLSLHLVVDHLQVSHRAIASRHNGLVGDDNRPVFGSVETSDRGRSSFNQFETFGTIDVDLPLNFHPVAIRAPALFMPWGAGGATCDRRSGSGLRRRSRVAERLAA